MQTIYAIYENGVLRPYHPVDLPEGWEGELQVRVVDDDQIRQELQHAFDQADRGEWLKLDIETFIREAHQRLGGFRK